MKKKITILLAILSGTIVILFMVLNWHAQVKMVNDDTLYSSKILFNQIKNIILQNDEDLQQTMEDSNADCLAHAHTAAYILQQNKSLISDSHELQKITDLLNVDEIHIFDKNGTIFAGSIPKYFGYTMNSGEQMRYFLPMLSDTSLELCQDITPNTAEGKLMQYAAVWMKDGSAIVQIGMEPHRVSKKIEKNELSFIFSLFTVDKGSALFAIDPETYKIIGSSKDYMLQKDLREYGIDSDDIKQSEKIFHYEIQGHPVCCVFEQTDTVTLGRILSEEKMYSSIRSASLHLFCSMLLITLILMLFILYYLNKIVVHPIEIINTQLHEIADGNFDVKIEQTSSPEFADLSAHINDMVIDILEITNTVSNLTETSELTIGIYEYHSGMDHVRITGCVPEILHLTAEETEVLVDDIEQFKEWMDRLLQNPFDKERNIYILDQGGQEYYIRIEQIIRKSGVFGILSEYTTSIRENQSLQKKLEQDLLTGLCSRRMLEYELDRLFENPELIKCGAIIVIDSDDLKKVNDTYGHENGDRYLRAIADSLTSLHAPEQMTARLGGDEFVIYFGGMQTQAEAEAYSDRLYKLRDNSIVYLTDGAEVLVRYSFGTVYFPTEGTNWSELMRLADERMYVDKRQRKKEAANDRSITE